jgi:uncharacterized protein YcbK (DUF882 family)
MHYLGKHIDRLFRVPFGRRVFLKLGMLGTTMTLWPGASIARLDEAWAPEMTGIKDSGEQPPGLPRPREERILHLYSINTKERFNSVYWANGEYVPEALVEINRLLRDYRTGEETEIDTDLLDLLYAVNRKLRENISYHVISGYRSPKTNEAMRKRDSRVARNSLHTAGRAVDILVPRGKLKPLHGAALALRYGGLLLLA